MRHRKFSITYWEQETATVETVSHSERQFPSSRILALLGTVLLHLTIFQSIVWGTQARKVRPPEVQGLGANLAISENPPSDTLILLELSNGVISEPTRIENPTSLGQNSRLSSIALLSPDSLPHVDVPAETLTDDPRANAAIDSGDPSNRAALFGRYTGQINARIERAWRRPRSPVKTESAAMEGSSSSHVRSETLDDIFRCQVRIVQNDQGNVEEVQLFSCNGSATWRQSLVSAILAVSPLPAPPSPSVFTRALTMTFTASQFSQGSVADDYELESTAPLSTSSRAEHDTATDYLRTSSPSGILLSHPSP